MYGQTERAIKVRELLIAFVAEESSKAKPNERLLGSSEVIESVFGKLKRLENNQAKSGFTGLLLSTMRKEAFGSCNTKEHKQDQILGTA